MSFNHSLPFQIKASLLRVVLSIIRAYFLSRFTPLMFPNVDFSNFSWLGKGLANLFYTGTYLIVDSKL